MYYVYLCITTHLFHLICFILSYLKLLFQPLLSCIYYHCYIIIETFNFRLCDFLYVCYSWAAQCWTRIPFEHLCLLVGVPLGVFPFLLVPFFFLPWCSVYHHSKRAQHCLMKCSHLQVSKLPTTTNSSLFLFRLCFLDFYNCSFAFHQMLIPISYVLILRLIILVQYF